MENTVEIEIDTSRIAISSSRVEIASIEQKENGKINFMSLQNFKFNKMSP
jgi:hypothetical protein